MIKKTRQYLPIEYPVRESLRIYARRLGIFSAIVFFNSLLLGLLLSISNFPVLNRALPILKISTIIIVAFLAYYVYRLCATMRKQRLVIQELAATIETTIPYRQKHSQRIMEYTAATAKLLGLSPDKVATIIYAAMLHDIGKIGINDGILGKPGSLTKKEWLKVKGHSRIGAHILSQIGSFREASKLVYYHHERYNGEGYPEKLRREDIPIGARILAVIDAYDAMTSKRPYRPAYSPQRAVAELKKKIGTQFDENVMKAFLKAIKEVRKMATPVHSRPTDKRFLGNSASGHMEVHDLHNEDTSPNVCQIDEIIEAGNAVVFDPDTLEQVHQEGYDNCAYCIGGSTR